jgi:hypothetical protein
MMIFEEGEVFILKRRALYWFSIYKWPAGLKRGFFIVPHHFLSGILNKV